MFFSLIERVFLHDRDRGRILPFRAVIIIFNIWERRLPRKCTFYWPPQLKLDNWHKGLYERSSGHYKNLFIWKYPGIAEISTSLKIAKLVGKVGQKFPILEKPIALIWLAVDEQGLKKGHYKAQKRFPIDQGGCIFGSKQILQQQAPQPVGIMAQKKNNTCEHYLHLFFPLVFFWGSTRIDYLVICCCSCSMNTIYGSNPFKPTSCKQTGSCSKTDPSLNRSMTLFRAVCMLLLPT